MKIAYLFSRYPVPSQTFCDTEICALEAAGHEIEIYSCSAPSTSFRHGGPADWPRAPLLYAPPAAVLHAWELAARAEGIWPEAMIAEHTARFGPRYDPARRARHALYFADRLRRRGVEHVHVHFANRATHAALFIQALTGVSFSFTAHAQDFLVDLGSDDLLRLLCERAAFVVTVSDWSRAALLERCPAAVAKVHRVYNGLALEHWPLPPDVPPDPAINTRLRILSVGRLIEFKGFQDLIAACGHLRERGVPFACEIVGDGPLREHLERRAAGFDEPSAQIRLTGLLPQEEVRARLRRCDVFTLASRVDEKGACDVLPTVILEAMAAAKPVLSTRLAGIPEMIEPARTGWLVPPGSPSALADALTELANGRETGARMGRAGRRKFEAEFTAAASARKLIGLFASATEAGAFSPARNTPSPASGGVLGLLDQWPPASRTDEPSLDALVSLMVSESSPEFRWLAWKPGQLAEASDTRTATASAESLRGGDFLPDPVVFETYWRNFLPQAYQLEGWRGEVGGGYAPDEYLFVCRVALYLQHAVLARADARRHLHAVGRLSLLCAWLLRRLGAVDGASFLLLSEPGGGVGLAGSTLRKLAPGFAGGWIVGERKLAAALGEGFDGAGFDGPTWRRKLARWSGQL